MIIMNIAEWIGNLFILGIAFILWTLGILMFGIFISLISEFIKKQTKEYE